MAAKVSLKLLIDQEKNRVVFAECNKDFVDVVLSFLVMPIGTIVRLADKESGLGCMDTLYWSVENLDMEYLQTEACKEMLLRPRNAWRANCNDLVVRINDLEYEYYRCPSWNESSEGHHFLSTVKNSKCRCGKLMDAISTPHFTDSSIGGKIGVFIKGNKMTYMITDNLHVTPISSSRVLTLLKELGIVHCCNLYEKNVEIGREEILHVLKRALLSETPLSDVFLGESDKVHTEDVKAYEMRMSLEKSEMPEKEMRMNIILSKMNNKVLYAEANEDVVDFFFRFLTFPLGLIPKLYNGISSVGCIDNLYASAKDLTDKDQMRTKEHTNMLLRPKLSPHHSCQNQILKLEEGASDSLLSKVTLHAINPKSTAFVTEKGGGFVEGPAMFMITNELDVKVASAIVGISVLKTSNVHLDDVEEKTVNVGEEEALMLLKASLVSTDPLSVVFGDKQRRLT